jgi:hypothetical protein
VKISTVNQFLKMNDSSEHLFDSFYQTLASPQSHLDRDAWNAFSSIFLACVCVCVCEREREREREIERSTCNFMQNVRLQYSQDINTELSRYCL